MARKWTEEEWYEQKHPSVDATARFAIDALLRKHGFVIHTRPRKGQTLWTKRGKLYKQSDALKTLDANDVADARYLEDLYGGK